MAVTVADLIAKLRVDTSQFQSGLAQSTLLYDQFGKTLVSRTSEAGTSQEKLGTQLDKTTSSINQLSQGAMAAGVSMGRLSTLAAAAVSPIGAVAAGLAMIGVTGYKSLQSFQENGRQIRDLMAVTGLQAEAADNLADTFELLGYDTGILSTAIFRMSDAAANNSEIFDKLHIRLRDSQGYLKTEGDLFLEVRDRIAAMGSAQERTAAIMDIFGKSGRALAPIFAMNRDMFKQFMAEASQLSPWGKRSQEESDQLRIAVARLSKTLEGFGTQIGLFLAGPATNVLNWFSDMLQKIRDAEAAMDQFKPGRRITAGQREYFGMDLDVAGATEAQARLSAAKPWTKQGTPSLGFVPGITLWSEMTEQQKQALETWNKSWTESAQAIVDEDFKTQQALVAIDEAAWKDRDALTEAGKQSWLQYIDAMKEADFAAARADADVWAAYWKERDQQTEEARQKEIEGWTAFAEQQKQLDELEARIELERLDAMVKKREETMNAARESFRDFFSSIADGISRSVQGVQMGTQTMGEAFRNLAQNILLSIQDMIIRRGLMELQKWLDQLIFSSGAGAASTGQGLWYSIGSMIGGLFGGGGGAGTGGGGGAGSGMGNYATAQTGGYFTRPTWTLLAEGGEPEYVIPESKMGRMGGGPTIVQVFSPQIGVPEAVRREVWAMLPAIKAQATEAVLTARGRGGDMSRAMGARR